MSVWLSKENRYQFSKMRLKLNHNECAKVTRARNCVFLCVFWGFICAFYTHMTFYALSQTWEIKSTSFFICTSACLKLFTACCTPVDETSCCHNLPTLSASILSVSYLLEAWFGKATCCHSCDLSHTHIHTPPLTNNRVWNRKPHHSTNQKGWVVQLSYSNAWKQSKLLFILTFLTSRLIFNL